MKYYEIEDLIRAIEEFSGFVDPDERERAFEESGLGDMLNILKEGVEDASEEGVENASEEESAEPAVAETEVQEDGSSASVDVDSESEPV